MQVEFERGKALKQETRRLPAAIYKTIRLRLSHHHQAHLFVPIRTMQYLAMISTDEIIFVDGRYPRLVELSWQQFQVNQRDNLQSAVAYTCVYYDKQAEITMKRLQNDFFKAIELLGSRETKPYSQRTVIPFNHKTKD